MRKELELIEKIEAYLQGRLSPAETEQFERQLADDPQLLTEVELQRQLMTGIQRASLRGSVLKAKKRYVFRRQFLKWGLGGLGTAGLIASLLYYQTSRNNVTLYEVNKLPAYNEAGERQWVDADRRLPAQTYLINASRDTVIETKKGIVLAISSRSFRDEDNRPVTGQVQVVMKEALDPASVMTAGLSTRSDTQMLSTGGMFFLDARQQGHILHIDTIRPITVQIPATEDRAGMQLYKGKRMSNGTINWVDPHPLERSLVSVDIQTLDFYPPHYLNSLQAWGYDSRDKRFTDSLYYSFSYFFHHPKIDMHIGNEDLDFGFLANDSDRVKNCGLDPAKIKTIWSPEFQNTIISTREFEERLRSLYYLGDNDLLDLYINHLDWNLSDIDSLVATQSLSSHYKHIFQAFADRHVGKVGNASPQLRQLAVYYKMKAQAYAAALSKTESDFWARQKELDSTSDAKRQQHQEDSFRRVAQNFRQEFDINFKEACRQLGYDTTINSLPPSQSVYTATITTTGWCNIDRAVTASTLTRTTLDYTDSATMKKAVIRYLPVSFQIADWKSLSRLYVYLLPDKLSSFMLMSGSEGVYTEKLNELLKYDLVCIGYKGDQAWYYHQGDIRPAVYTNIQLKSVSAEELASQLNQAGNLTQAEELRKENSFSEFDIQDQKRRKRLKDLRELRIRVGRIVTRCGIYYSTPTEDEGY